MRICRAYGTRILIGAFNAGLKAHSTCGRFIQVLDLCRLFSLILDIGRTSTYSFVSLYVYECGLDWAVQVISFL